MKRASACNARVMNYGPSLALNEAMPNTTSAPKNHLACELRKRNAVRVQCRSNRPEAWGGHATST